MVIMDVGCDYDDVEGCSYAGCGCVMFDVTTITDVTLMPLLFLLQNAIVKEVCNPEALLTMMKVSKDFNQSFQYSTVGAYQCCCIRFSIMDLPSELYR